MRFEPRLIRSDEDARYRIVQEALTNTLSTRAHRVPPCICVAGRESWLEAHVRQRLRRADRLLGLLRHPRFATTVDSIVVEFGNARFQILADRYVAGRDVSPKALSPVWRDTVGAALDGVVDEAAGRFFAAVRRLNQTLPAKRRIRVALGDPAFDFRALRRRDDLDPVLRRRDRVFAAAAEREARGGRHVLLLSALAKRR